ncbi:MAG: transporter substrate-binding domain-containing protein [Methylococcaceae bacterium]|nr:transporter substrate-binding domain-containing protein [Methylococcaceae bacterium]
MNLGRIIKFFLLWFSILTFSFSSYADDVPSISADMQRIKDSGKLVVAMYFEDVPPFAMQNKNKEFVGIDVDIARDIAKKLGVEVVFNREPKTYDEIVQYVFEKKADIAISLLSDTLARAMFVRFSKPYWSVKQALLINRLKLSTYKNHPDFKNIKMLLNQKSIRIGVIEGSSYVDFAKKDFPLAEIIVYKKSSEGINATKQSKIMAFLYDETEVMNWVKKYPEDSLYLRPHSLKESDDTLAFAVQSQDEQLLHWLNLYIEKSKGNFFKQLQKKYTDK